MDLLEQDMAVVMGQSEELGTDERPLRDVWLPIKSSDQLVLQYRRWIEDHAAKTPGALGWRTRNDVPPSSGDRPDIGRHALHTRHCSACREALGRMEQVRRYGAISAFGATIAAALASGPISLVAAGAAILAVVTALRANRNITELTRGPRQ